MTAEYKRYYANKGDIWEDNEVGEYVRFADVEAYTQAAIAAAMMGALDNFPADWRERAEEMRGVFKMQKAWSDGFNAARSALAASIPTDGLAALGAALMRAYKEGWSDGAANCHHDRNETPDDGWLISDTYKSIPTDATAAAIRAMKGGA